MEENSTRLSILERANAIINQIGMSDFRIDTLSQSLKISPGNITYHFPKKDDISYYIWKRCQKELHTIAAGQINQFMDLKQLYLLFRQIISTLYSYRGTLNYMLGDSGVMRRLRQENRELWSEVYGEYKKIKGYLVASNSIREFEDDNLDRLCFESHILILGWSVNYAYSDSVSDVGSLAERQAFVSLSPLVPFLDEPGKRQYTEILSLIK